MTRTPKLFTAAFLVLSLATLVVAFALRHHPAMVNPAVWVRGTIVAASALLAHIFAVRGLVRRLRILTIIWIVAIAVIVSLPGTFPLWLKLEQVACGLLLLGVLFTLPRRSARSESRSTDAADDLHTGHLA
jgi:hypothetical protein